MRDCRGESRSVLDGARPNSGRHLAFPSVCCVGDLSELRSELSVAPEQEENRIKLDNRKGMNGWGSLEDKSKGFRLPRKWGGFKGVWSGPAFMRFFLGGVEFTRYDWHGIIPANESLSCQFNAGKVVRPFPRRTGKGIICVLIRVCW